MQKRVRGACRTVNTPVGVLLHVDLLVILAPHPPQTSRLTAAGIEAEFHTDRVQVVGGGLDAVWEDLGVCDDGAVWEAPGHPAVICSRKNSSQKHQRRRRAQQHSPRLTYS
eukprot:COSAG02_NODE_5415_length_4348_cov_2.023770_5_plen_111_part_00